MTTPNLSSLRVPDAEPSVLPEPGSFREQHNRVLYWQGEVLRGLSPHALEEWERLQATRFFPEALQRGHLIPTERFTETHHLPPELLESWPAVLRHQKIPFISYPYEWSFGMLKDAALLQLDLLLAALNEDMILKDASAYNVQWLGTQPVFIDITSFERLQPGEPWVGYRQFCQLFLYPLFLQAYKQIPFHPWLRGSIDGITPSQIRPVMSLRDGLRSGVFSHVMLQAMLERSQSNQSVKRELVESGFHKSLILTNIQKLKRLVTQLQWAESRSTWSDYAGQNSYAPQETEAKADFVRQAVQSQRWPLVWDLGCNTGVFSRIAAENADYVVAVDGDHLSVERLYQTLKAEGNRSILPLVNNLADMSAGLGWRGQERKAITQRGHVDLTLCLALVHHMVIGANIPLAEWVAWLSELGSALVIEFVTKADPMVQTLLRNKADIYDDYTVDAFERYLQRHFEIVRQQPVQGGQRILYFATPKH